MYRSFPPCGVVARATPAQRDNVSMPVMTDIRDRRGAIHAARSMAGALESRATEADRLHTLPADLVEELKAAGLFRLALPERLGGLELDPVTMIEVIEEIARADGSAGWTVLIGNSTSFFSWLEPHVAERLVGQGHDVVSATMFGPLGTAVAQDDGSFLVEGRWPFVSGSPHADWFLLGVVVVGVDDPPPAGSPFDWRFAYLSRDQVRVEDTWDAVGLVGTGSHHVQVPPTRIPAEQLAAPLFGSAKQDGPLWRVPFFTQVGIALAGFPLGVGRRALDEFAALARDRTRGGDSTVIASDEHVQLELGRVEAGLRAARSLVIDLAGALWATVNAGEHITLDQRAEFTSSVINAMTAATDAVDVAFRFAGSSVVAADHPLQRCFRDIHVANQHIYFSSGARKRFGRHLLGLDQPATML